MATIYLIEQNTVLRKTSSRLRFCQRPPCNRRSPGVRVADVIMEWACKDIEHVMVFGNVQITTQAMHFLLINGIETALFSQNGHLLGQLTPPMAKNILLRCNQYARLEEASFCLGLSRSLVESKIENQERILTEYNKNHPGTCSAEEIHLFHQYREHARNIDSIEKLRGVEGAASAHYFKLLSRFLPQQWNFTGRNRRPPKDPPNAILSFGYTIVMSELWSLLDGMGFDPFLGFYHQKHYGRPGLALDILELFRHSLVDRLMLRMFNLNILNHDDFHKVTGGGIYLNQEGKKKFFREYEKFVGRYRGEVMMHEESGRFRRIFQDQIESLAKSINDNSNLEVYDQ